MVFKAFPLKWDDAADYTGPFVAFASRRNSATTTGEVVNAADGLGIRGTTFMTDEHFKQGYVQG